MIIYLVRHGETEWNREGKAQGREDIPLNARGLHQAEQLAECMANVPLDCVITSPLKRAVATGAVIAQSKGLPKPDPTLHPEFIEPALIERDYGALSGRIVTKENRSTFFLDDTEGRYPGIESVSSCMDRMEGLLMRYAAKPYSHVLMVAHGAVINALLERLSKGEYGGAKTWLVNTCINILEVTETKVSTAPDSDTDSGAFEPAVLKCEPVIRVLAYNLTGEEFLRSEYAKPKGEVSPSASRDSAEPAHRPCKKCLLADIDETEVFERIQQLIQLMPEREKVDSATYRKRLDACLACEQLSHATCTFCGCYVELRAIKKKEHCPNPAHRW